MPFPSEIGCLRKMYSAFVQGAPHAHVPTCAQAFSICCTTTLRKRAQLAAQWTDMNDDNLEPTEVTRLARPGRARSLSLVVMSSAGVFTYPIDKDGAILVGRGTDCDVAITDVKASRRHALLTVGEELMVTDLGST